MPAIFVALQDASQVSDFTRLHGAAFKLTVTLSTPTDVIFPICVWALGPSDT